MKIKINTKAIIKNVQRAQSSVPRKVNRLVMNAALRTVARAKSKLQPRPEDDAELAADIGGVRQSITFQFTQGKNITEATVTAGNTAGDHMAAYLEFGTGKYAARHVATLAPDFQQLARTFYVNGKGRLREHPYLIGPFLDEGKKLSDRLNNLKVDW